MRIVAGTTDHYVYFVAVDSTDLKTRETGLSSFTVYYSINGGAATAMTTPTVNETDATNMPGVYELLIDESGMTTLSAGDDTSELALHITQASMAPVTRTIEVYRPETTAGNTLTVASDGDLTEVNTLTGHTAQTGDSFARIGANGASLSAIPWNASWDAEVESEVTDALNAYDPPTKAELDTGFSYLYQHTGTAQAGGASSITLAAGASSTNSTYVGMMVFIVSGTGAGQTRRIGSYDGTTKVATVSTAWTTNPASGSVYSILPMARVDVGAWVGTAPNSLVSGRMDASVGAMAANVLTGSAINTGAITNAKFAAGAIDAAAIASNAITAAKIATDAIGAAQIAADAIGASELATDAANEIRDAVWAATTRVLTANTNLNDPTAAAIADAVWDEAQADHVAAGSFGETATEIAEILTDTGTTLDGKIDTIDTNVDAILVDTGTTLETHLTDIKGATFSGATDSLEAIRDRGDAAWTTGGGGSNPMVLQNTTIATLASQTSFTLTAGSADDNAYNDALCVVTDSATSTQKAVGYISGYTGSTKTVTLAADPGIFTMAVGDTIDVIAMRGTNAAALASALATVDSNVDAILLDTAEIGTAGAGLTAVPWNAAWDAEVESEVTDALNAAQAEPTGAPAANESLADKVNYMFAALRNKIDVTASAKTFYDDAGTSLWSKSLTDNGTTYSEAEGA